MASNNSLKQSVRKNNKVLFIGNGINNLNNKESWENILRKLSEKAGNLDDIDELKREFPLGYENLLLHGMRHKQVSEIDLKHIIAENVIKIVPNEIHERINGIKPFHIITTNYDYVLENGLDWQKSGKIEETKYSIFRRYTDFWNGRNIWHIHGEINNLNSINLGYEHYCGQLQMLRNYVVSGTQYESKKVNKIALIHRLNSLSENPDSWVDLLFSNEVHIIGLRMDFIEIDLWWLLTYRAKLIVTKSREIKNKIFYYIPEEHVPDAKGKIKLLRNMGIMVITIKKGGIDYFHDVLNKVEQGLKLSDIILS